MKNKSLKNTITPFLSFVPFNFLKKITGDKLIIPLYHLVTDNPPLHVKNLYNPRPVKNFMEDLDFFTSNFKVLSPDEFYAVIDDPAKSKKNGFMLTFDDGLREIYEFIAPYLYQMGIPAIFFINNNFVDNRDMFYRFKVSLLIERINQCPNKSALKKVSGLIGLNGQKRSTMCNEILKFNYLDNEVLDLAGEVLQIDFKEYLKENKPYMDSNQIRELQKKGFIIGSHTKDHQLLTGLTETEIICKLKESMDQLIQEFSPRYRYFAFPFSDYGINKDIISRIHNLKDLLIDASFGSSGLKPIVEKRHIQRIPMEVKGRSARQILITDYLIFFLRKNIIGW